MAFAHRAQNSATFCCVPWASVFLAIAHRPMSSSVLRRVGTDEYQAMLVCKQMQTEWSSETIMVGFVEQTGANTLILATRDADTQLWKLSHLHPRIQITCSSSEKPWSRAALITYTSHERNALYACRYSANCRGISWRRQTTARHGEEAAESLCIHSCAWKLGLCLWMCNCLLSTNK